MNDKQFDYTNFQNQIQSFLEKGKILLESNPKDESDYELFTNSYKEWRNSISNFLNDIFGRESYYSRTFLYSNSNRFNIGIQKSIEQKIKEKKEDINSDLRHIPFILNLVSISDILTKPNEVNIEIRKNYTSEEILELILEKLYDLYGDGIYPIIPILEGNGINLKRRREEFELIEVLENNGLIRSNNIAREADAQLTVNGKIYVEEKRKLIKPNYNSITSDKDEMNANIDKLKLELEKLGYGQQIIFDELEDLREYYTQLNKKNWAQLFKGKIVDLGLSNLVSNDVLKMIYESVVHDTLKLK